MKVAITDACIFIDVIELGLAKSFFGLPIEMHTSLDVFNELKELISTNTFYQNNTQLMSEIFGRIDSWSKKT